MRLFIVLLFFANGFAFGQTTPVAGYLTASDGIRINYEVAGKGKPVILIHGFSNTQENWKRTALYDSLLTNGFQVITLDLRGNGKSDKPHDPKYYANDAEARDVMQLADHLRLRKYLVVGYSRGAIIASRVLILDKRVSKAVMGGMGIDFTNPDWPRRIMFYRALNNEDVPELKGFMKYVKDSGLDQEALACQQKEQPSTSIEAFKSVKSPVLVICGDDDSDNGSAQELSKVIPGATYTTVPGNHNNTSRSDRFAREVMAFLVSN